MKDPQEKDDCIFLSRSNENVIANHKVTLMVNLSSQKKKLLGAYARK